MRYRVTYNAVQTVEVDAEDVHGALDIGIMRFDSRAWKMDTECVVQSRKDDGTWHTEGVFRA